MKDTEFITGCSRLIRTNWYSTKKLSEVLEEFDELAETIPPREFTLITTKNDFKFMNELSKYQNRNEKYIVTQEEPVSVNHFYRRKCPRLMLCAGTLHEDKSYFICLNSLCEIGYVHEGNQVLRAINGNSATVIQYLMNYDDYVLDQIKKKMNGPHFGFFNIPLDEIKIRIPAVEEQRRIEKALILYDRRIKAEAEYIEQLQRIKKACMEKMFPNN